MKNILLGCLMAFPAFAAPTLKCEPTKQVLFNHTTVNSLRATAHKVVLTVEIPTNLTPMPGQSRLVDLTYPVRAWDWSNGLTISGMSTEITPGQHGTATIRIPSLKSAAACAPLKVYQGTATLLPSSRLVKPRVATKFTVHCVFRR